MSFTTRSLMRIAQVPVGSTGGVAGTALSALFRYSTNDAAATVETAGYFNNARLQLVPGDVIIATMAVSGTPVLKQYVVTASPTSGNVTVALQTTTSG